MEKELEEGQKISQPDLSREGWEKIGPYANLIAFYKDERNLLWDPKTKKIDQIFLD